jgi:tetratricopeptide (TPR) repeat protein
VTALGPIDLKNGVIDGLSPYVDESKRIKKAIKEIEKSLDAKSWIDEIYLDKKHGKKVFDHERHAVRELEHLLKGTPDDAKCDGIALIELEYTGSGTDVVIEVFLKKVLLGTFTVSQGDTFVVEATDETKGKLHSEITLVVNGEEAAKIHTSCSKPIEVGDVHGDFEITDLEKLFSAGKGKKKQISDEALAAVQPSIDALVKADRILAETLLIEAQAVPVSDPNKQDKVDREIAKAFEELTKGDADRDTGKFDKAIRHYKKAWEHASHAIKEATKEAKSDKCRGITSMTLVYTGGAGANITADKGHVTDNGDGTYTITPENGKDKLSANTKISVGGQPHTEIHTSCSKPTDIGDVHNDFTITALQKLF